MKKELCDTKVERSALVANIELQAAVTRTLKTKRISVKDLHVKQIAASVLHKERDKGANIHIEMIPRYFLIVDNRL